MKIRRTNLNLIERAADERELITLWWEEKGRVNKQLSTGNRMTHLVMHTTTSYHRVCPSPGTKCRSIPAANQRLISPIDRSFVSIPFARIPKEIYMYTNIDVYRMSIITRQQTTLTAQFDIPNGDDGCVRKYLHSIVSVRICERCGGVEVRGWSISRLGIYLYTHTSLSLSLCTVGPNWMVYP